MEDVVIAVVLWFRGQATFPPTPLAPTASARKSNVTARIRGCHTSHTSPGIRIGGGECPTSSLVRVSLCDGNVSVLLLADCSLCFVGWLGSSSQAEQACRSLGVPEGQWEGGDPRGPSAQPPRGGGGSGWRRGEGSVCWSYSGSDVTFRANKTCDTWQTPAAA